MVKRYAELVCNGLEVWIKSHTITQLGRALKYYATIRFEIKRAESIKDSSGIVGQ